MSLQVTKLSSFDDFVVGNVVMVSTSEMLNLETFLAVPATIASIRDALGLTSDYSQISFQHDSIFLNSQFTYNIILTFLKTV